MSIDLILSSLIKRSISESRSHGGYSFQSLVSLNHGLLPASILLNLHVMEYKQGEEVPIFQYLLLRHHELQFFN